jgi:MYXO-CTERM domain-containing protein
LIQSPDGSTLCVLDRSGSISVIDTATDTVTGTFTLTGLYYDHPYAGVISQDGKTLYITDEDYDAYAINAQTGAVGDLPASDSFTWEAMLPMTCAADPGGMTQGTVTFVWTPSFGPIGSLSLESGQPSGTISFNVYASSPVILTATSSDPAVVPAGAISLSQDCEGTCILNLTAGASGSSTITLTATEPSSGATASTTFSVAVTPASTSGGGGGVGPWILLGLLAFVLLRRRQTVS